MLGPNQQLFKSCGSLIMERTTISGVLKIPNKVYEDSRGHFTKVYSKDMFESDRLEFNVAQINLSMTTRTGTIRGMHYQAPPHGEAKIIRCIQGRVLDVIVDIRRDSSTFLKHQVFEMSELHGFALHVPIGCAHGFQVLDGPAKMLYAHSHEYRPEFERGIHPLDPALGINWPLKVVEISERDKTQPLLTGSFEGISS